MPESFAVLKKDLPLLCNDKCESIFAIPAEN